MNVLLSAYACRPNTGSEPGMGWNWAIHLAEAGCEVYLVTSAERQDEVEAYLKEFPCPRLHRYYVPVPWLSPSRYGKSYHYLSWQWASLRKARELMRTFAIDVAHHVSYGTVLLPTQLWRLGLPTVFGPVGGANISPDSLRPYFGKQATSEGVRTRLIGFLPRLWLFRLWMQKMSVVYAANSETRELAYRAGCNTVEMLCDTGMRSDYISTAPRHFDRLSPLRLLWVGTFVPRKGLALALDSLARTDSNIHLTLVGNGLPVAMVHRMISDRGLEGRVHWTGARSTWMEVREAYATHDALLFTSLRDSFGSQNLEAMGSGLPIITLSLSGAKDFIPDHAGLKVEVGPTLADTVTNLSEAMNLFARLSLVERNRMSDAVWREAHSFAWTKRAEKAMALYAGLENKHSTCVKANIS
jgi:glycosyltransferase involved in cell wall biosynthesis